MATSVMRRVQSLEEMMADLIRAQVRTDEQLRRTDEQLQRTDAQLQRTDAQIARTSREMAEFKDEMVEFREDMTKFREESRRESREASRKWGELSNKMGTMVEDLVAPSIERILRETVNCPEGEIKFSGIRVKGRSTLDSSRSREFDAMAVCGNYVLVNETKSTLTAESIQKFIEVLPTVAEYFPQYADHQIIGAISSLYVREDVVRYGERQGLLVLGFGNWTMNILNSEGFRPKNFAPAA